MHVVLVVPRRQADVVHARARGEGMHRLVEAPRVGGEAEVLEDLALHPLLASIGNSPAGTSRRRLRRAPRSQAMSGTRPPSTCRRPRAPRPSSCRARSRRAGGRSPRPRAGSTGRTAARSITFSRYGWNIAQSDCLRASSQTGTATADMRELAVSQADADELVVVAADDADEGRFVRVVALLFGPRLGLVEELPHLGRREHRVDDLRERALELFGPGGGAVSGIIVRV